MKFDVDTYRVALTQAYYTRNDVLLHRLKARLFRERPYTHKWFVKRVVTAQVTWAGSGYDLVVEDRSWRRVVEPLTQFLTRLWGLPRWAWGPVWRINNWVYAGDRLVAVVPCTRDEANAVQPGAFRYSEAGDW